MLGASGEQPASTLFGQQAAALPGMVASLLVGARPPQELRPFELKPVAWQQRSWEQQRHHHYVGGDAAGTAAQPAPRHQHMMMMGGGGHDMWQRAAVAAAVEEQAKAPALPQVAEERSVDWMALEVRPHRGGEEEAAHREGKGMTAVLQVLPLQRLMPLLPVATLPVSASQRLLAAAALLIWIALTGPAHSHGCAGAGWKEHMLLKSTVG